MHSFLKYTLYKETFYKMCNYKSLALQARGRNYKNNS